MANYEYLILVGDGVDERELNEIYGLLPNPDTGTTLLGRHAGDVYVSESGEDYVEAQVGLDEIYLSDYTGLIVPGGYMPFLLSTPPFLHELQEAFSYGLPRILAASCLGPWLLMKTGVLSGGAQIRVTSHYAIREDLVDYGCDWLGLPAVSDPCSCPYGEETVFVTGRSLVEVPYFVDEIRAQQTLMASRFALVKSEAKPAKRKTSIERAQEVGGSA